MAKATPSDIMPGAEVARELGIYLGQLYGWEKKGLNIHHDPPANAKSKSKTWVSLSEAQTHAANIKHKGPRATNADGTKAAKGPRPKSVKVEKRAKVKAGDVVSWDRGRMPDYDSKGHSVAQVTGQTGRVIHLEGHSPTGLHHYVFTTESLAHRMAAGLVKLETPESVMGMVLLQWIRDGEEVLAQSLEDWMDANGVEVIVPELVESLAEEIEYTEEVVDDDADEG